MDKWLNHNPQSNPAGWNKVDEGLPPVDPDTGESDYVLCYFGHGLLPEMMKYSDGTWSKRGWWDTRFHHHPEKGRKGPTVTHWAKLEYPKEEGK